MNILTKECKICGKIYYKKSNISLSAWKKGSKYCSWECQHKGLIGNTPWNKGKSTGYVPKTAFKKGHLSWHKDTKGVSASGEKHGRWKGDDVSYSGLHYWVARWKGRPKKCEQCGATNKKKYEWANVDHKYNRILDDYIRMCTACHRKYDRDVLKIKICK